MAVPGFGATLCDVSGNIVANCGFENGTNSSTIDGNTNNSVPVSWTPNAAYDSQTGFNNLRSSPVNSGFLALSIGNTDAEPVPSLSQTLTDVAGATYSGSLFVDYGGAGQGDTSSAVFFDTLINGVAVQSLNSSAPGVCIQYFFSFIGTGSDVLTLEGNTSPSEWLVDDIVVTESSGPPVVGTTPEPSSIALFGTGILGIAGVVRKRLAA
ncbi:MAG: PEP-CTERM sorting domain-containing protein [Edaphobacter sp.]